jgi:hypothetical protein
MSSKVSTYTTPEMAERVAQAMKSLKTMSWEKKIELMVKAKALTPKQAATARKALVKADSAPGMSTAVKSRASAKPKAAKKK